DGNPSTFTLVNVDNGSAVGRAALHDRRAGCQLGKPVTIPAQDLGLDPTCLLGPHERHAAAAEPRAAEPGPDDAVGLDEDPVERDERRAAGLVIDDRALARGRHERAEPVEIACAPGVDTPGDPLDLREDVSRAPGRRIAKAIPVAIVFVW